MVSVNNDAKYAIASSDFRCLKCESEVACEAPYYSVVILGDDAFQRRNYCVDCWKREVPARSGEAEAGSGVAPFASWRTRRPAAPTDRPRKVRFDPQVGMEFFLRLGEHDAAGAPDAPEQAAPAFEREASEADVPETPGDVDVSDAEMSPDAGERPAERADDAAERGEPSPPSTVVEERERLRFLLALLLVRKRALTFKSSIERGGREFLLLADRETPPHVHEVLNPDLSEGQLEGLKDRLGELLQMQI